MCVAFLVLLLHVAHIVFSPPPFLVCIYTRDIISCSFTLVAVFCVCVCVCVCVFYLWASLFRVPLRHFFFFLDEGPLLFSSFFFPRLLLLFYCRLPPSPPHLYLYFSPFFFLHRSWQVSAVSCADASDGLFFFLHSPYQSDR